MVDRHVLHDLLPNLIEGGPKAKARDMAKSILDTSRIRGAIIDLDAVETCIVVDALIMYGDSNG